MEIEKKIENAKKHSEDVANAYVALKDKQKEMEEEQYRDIITRAIKRDKRKGKGPQDAKRLREMNEERMIQAKERLQELKREEKYQKEKLLEQKKQREQVADQIRKELAEAHREYFEIMKLKKLD